MATVTQAACACAPCVCTVDPASAIQKNGKSYCSDACANNHPEGESSCSQSSCGCCS
ncbi:MAG: metallothionein [Geitlerinemataceae cyanobacterium]